MGSTTETVVTGPIVFEGDFDEDKIIEEMKKKGAATTTTTPLTVTVTEEIVEAKKPKVEKAKKQKDVIETHPKATDIKTSFHYKQSSQLIFKGPVYVKGQRIDPTTGKPKQDVEANKEEKQTKKEKTSLRKS